LYINLKIETMNEKSVNFPALYQIILKHR